MTNGGPLGSTASRPHHARARLLSVLIVGTVLLTGGGALWGGPGPSHGSVALAPFDRLSPAAPGVPPVSTTNVPVGNSPIGAATDTRNGELYIANYGSANVTVLNGTSVIGTVGVPVQPDSLVYDEEDGYVYVSSTGTSPADAAVSVIDGTTLVGTIRPGSEVSGSVFDPRNAYVYVESAPDNLTVIRGTQVVGTVSVCNDPISEAYDGGNGYVYVGCWTPTTRSSAVDVINGTTVIGNISAVDRPTSITYDSGNGYVYVTDMLSDSVSVLSGTTLAASVGAGGYPTSAAYDRQDGFVYVTNDLSDNVSVLNGTTVLGEVTVGVAPQFATYDGGSGDIYVLNHGGSDASVIDGMSVVGTVDAGDYPQFATFDAVNGYLYVLNYDSGNVTVVTAGCRLSFWETGLPPGTNWSVSLTSTSPGLVLEMGRNLTRWSDGAAVVTFAVSVGNYSYVPSIPVSPGIPSYGASPGSVEVLGSAPTTLAVGFSLGTGPPNTQPVVPGWAVGLGIALLLIGAIGLAMTTTRYRAQERRRGRVAVARMGAIDWSRDESGDPSPRHGR
jgi:YVTN family beta-propeller protein